MHRKVHILGASRRSIPSAFAEGKEGKAGRPGPSRTGAMIHVFNKCSDVKGRSRYRISCKISPVGALPCGNVFGMVRALSRSG